MNKITPEQLAQEIVNELGGCFVPIHCFQKRIPYNRMSFDPYSKSRNRSLTKHTNEENERQRQWMILAATDILKKLGYDK